MPQYQFEIEIKDDDLLRTLEVHQFVLEAGSEEEALSKFEWIANERGWLAHSTDEWVDGQWQPTTQTAHQPRVGEPNDPSVQLPPIQRSPLQDNELT